MIFGHKRHPYYGDTRRTRQFAFFPVRFISGGWIWMQYYYADLIFTRTETGEDTGYWKVDCRYVNDTSNIY